MVEGLYIFLLFLSLAHHMPGYLLNVLRNNPSSSAAYYKLLLYLMFLSIKIINTWPSMADGRRQLTGSDMPQYKRTISVCRPDEVCRHIVCVKRELGQTEMFSSSDQ